MYWHGSKTIISVNYIPKFIINGDGEIVTVHNYVQLISNTCYIQFLIT